MGCLPLQHGGPTDAALTHNCTPVPVATSATTCLLSFMQPCSLPNPGRCVGEPPADCPMLGWVISSSEAELCDQQSQQLLQ